MRSDLLRKRIILIALLILINLTLFCAIIISLQMTRKGGKAEGDKKSKAVSGAVSVAEQQPASGSDENNGEQESKGEGSAEKTDENNQENTEEKENQEVNSDNKPEDTVQEDIISEEPEASIGENTDDIGEELEEVSVEESSEEPSDEISDEPSDFDYPEGAMSFNGHYYYIYNDVTSSWENALIKCIERGGYLAVINDSEENEVLYQYMLDMGYEEAFFGLAYNSEENDWRYRYGDTSSFLDWGYNSKGDPEPNHTDRKENYVELDIHVNNGHWNDAQFGVETYTPKGQKYKDLHAYICEWEQ